MPVTNYIYDPVTEAYLMETDGDGNMTAWYTQEPVKYGDIIAQHRVDPATGVGKSYYYHPDALGSTRELTDESGTVVATYNYDAFGNTIASTGTVENPFRYTGNVGYYWDEELQAYHIRARNYQPTTGRWTSQDPIGFAGGDTNLFRYVSNSVLNNRDPSGLGDEEFPVLNEIARPILDGIRADMPAYIREIPGNRIHGRTSGLNGVPIGEGPCYHFATDFYEALRHAIRYDELPLGTTTGWVEYEVKTPPGKKVTAKMHIVVTVTCQGTTVYYDSGMSCVDYGSIGQYSGAINPQVLDNMLSDGIMSPNDIPEVVGRRPPTSSFPPYSPAPAPTPWKPTPPPTRPMLRPPVKRMYWFFPPCSSSPHYINPLLHPLQKSPGNIGPIS